MRGDSLRDLYAKALALFGLALLAGVGALVDYWPASGQLPAVASLGVTPAPPAHPSIASLNSSGQSQSQSQSLAPRASGAPIAVTRRAPVRRAARTAIVALGILPVAADIPFAEGVPLGEPPLPAAATPVPATSVPAPEIELPAAPEAALPLGPIPPDAPLVDRSSEGFFGTATSAFKKTGESIVNTTVKTGASIIKAFGIVGGAFKKVI
ncbi:MAG TPA: hypothetical protein VES67_13170 [Vicinamibacterales bacterium]|nr:hypothetical protein [Vicinamibacterales bacterium]